MYALICESTGETAVIDPSCQTTDEWNKLYSHLDDHARSTNGKYDRLTVNHILLTHGHFDHVAGVHHAMNKWPHASLYLHPLEEENYRLAPQQARQHNFQLDSSPLPSPTRELVDGEILTIGESIRLRVVHTPGHAPGHVAFVDDRPTSPPPALPLDQAKTETRQNQQPQQQQGGSVIVSGDLLFRGSVGSTIMFNSSMEDLYASLRRLYDMNHADSIVLSGHTTPTTLRTEQQANPYVQWALKLQSEYMDERHEWKNH
jgi:hydroxyacylglutathione hydrolase